MPLVKSESAVRTLQMLSTASGRRARLGDPNAFGDEPRAKNLLTEVGKVVGDGVGIVDKLDRDLSRTDVSKHHRARKEAGVVAGAINSAAGKLNELAKEYTISAEEQLNEFLDLNAVNPTMLAMKTAWIAKQWQDPDGGAGRIRETLKTDRDLAAIMYGVNSYLLEMPEDARLKFVEAGVKSHAPEAEAKIGMARRLRDTAAKLPAVANDVHATFYLEGIAAQMNTRVED